MLVHQLQAGLVVHRLPRVAAGSRHREYCITTRSFLHSGSGALDTTACRSSSPRCWMQLTCQRSQRVERSFGCDISGRLHPVDAAELIVDSSGMMARRGTRVRWRPTLWLHQRLARRSFLTDTPGDEPKQQMPAIFVSAQSVAAMAQWPQRQGPGAVHLGPTALPAPCQLG